MPTHKDFSFDMYKQKTDYFLLPLKHKMQTHTHHWPYIFQVISQLNIRKGLLFVHFDTHTLTQSKNPASNFLSQGDSGGPGRGKVFGKQKEPFQPAPFSLCAREVDIGISCLSFSCGVPLVGRVGNSCLRHTKVSLLGLTVSVSVQRKESILLDYGCALSVKQQTCSV